MQELQELQEIQGLLQAYQEWCKTKDDELRLTKENKWMEYRQRIAELTVIPAHTSSPHLPQAVIQVPAEAGARRQTAWAGVYRVR